MQFIPLARAAAQLVTTVVPEPAFLKEAPFSANRQTQTSPQSIPENLVSVTNDESEIRQQSPGPLSIQNGESEIRQKSPESWSKQLIAAQPVSVESGEPKGHGKIMSYVKYAASEAWRSGQRVMGEETARFEERANRAPKHGVFRTADGGVMVAPFVVNHPIIADRPPVILPSPSFIHGGFQALISRGRIHTLQYDRAEGKFHLARPKEQKFPDSTQLGSKDNKSWHKGLVSVLKHHPLRIDTAHTQRFIELSKGIDLTKTPAADLTPAQRGIQRYLECAKHLTELVEEVRKAPEAIDENSPLGQKIRTAIVEYGEARREAKKCCLDEKIHTYDTTERNIRMLEGMFKVAKPLLGLAMTSLFLSGEFSTDPSSGVTHDTVSPSSGSTEEAYLGGPGSVGSPDSGFDEGLDLDSINNTGASDESISDSIDDTDLAEDEVFDDSDWDEEEVTDGLKKVAEEPIQQAQNFASRLFWSGEKNWLELNSASAPDWTGNLEQPQNSDNLDPQGNQHEQESVRIKRAAYLYDGPQDEDVVQLKENRQLEENGKFARSGRTKPAPTQPGFANSGPEFEGHRHQVWNSGPKAGTTTSGGSAPTWLDKLTARIFGWKP